MHPWPNSNSPASPTDAPHFGSVMGKLRTPDKPVPPCVIVGGRILPQFQGIGQTGGYLGMAHAPYVAPQGDAVINHYGTLLSAGHGPELSLPSDVSLERLNHRRQMLHRLELAFVSDGVQSRKSGFTHVQQRAFDMIGGLEMAAALDVERESPEVR
ncbi:MAG: DUF1501 domain-containing protein, partial [Planctomycetota bacterium]|nr:DUF1501 domain-containing protein [Planctomycetota bacterium]